MANITLTSGNDKKIGTADNDKIDGLAGNDTISGMNGNDTLLGGTGNDYLEGGVGNDSLLGGAGADTLLGGSDHDSLKGEADNDRLDGGKGNDTLDGGTGSDTLIGGDGNDTYYVDNARDLVTETTGATSGKDSVKSSITYSLPLNVENLELTGLTDLNGTGNDSNNLILGNSGNNLLDGKNGADTLQGGTGDDTLIGGGGVDVLNGGDGSDTYKVGSNEDKIIETARDGDEDVVESTVSYSLGDNLEVLTLVGPAALSGTGNKLDNVIEGSEVGNALYGEAGDDSILGYDGADTIDGGAGNDTIDGGKGQDTVIYQGNQNDYKITYDADSETWTVEDVTGDSGDDGVDEGTDLIKDVGLLIFADGDKPLSPGDLGGETPTPPVTIKPELSISGVTLMEGNTGTTNAVLTVNLSAKSTDSITVAFSTQDGTALAGSDYVAKTDTLTFAPGVTSQQINIPVNGDLLNEADETFSVSLSNARNATLPTASSANVTLQNDDPVPSVTISNMTSAASITEGNTGTTPVTVTLTLSDASDLPVSVNWKTVDGTALASDRDYLPETGIINFAPGVTEQSFTVQVQGDTRLEKDETFAAEISNPINATLGANTTAQFLIRNDDRAVPTPFDDYLEETADNDDVDALAGNDTVLGFGGNDTITGNDGNDSIDGGDGDDQVLGGEGNDTLLASNGNDTLSGGLGDDSFVINGTPTGTLLIEDTGGNDTLDTSNAGSAANINLTPGQTSTVGGLTITLSAGGKVSDPLDTYFLQDVSGSFEDDVDTVLNIVPKVVGAINTFQPDSLVGLGSFIDKPVDPFGSPFGDYVFREELGMTKNQTAFSNALNALVIGDGNDIPEAQLEALMQVALRSDAIGFRGDAVKVVVLMTDAPFHQAGDGKSAHITKTNNGNATLDGSPAGTGEDYPSVAMAASALKQAGILPIFAVTKNAVTTYQKLVADLGVGSVVTLSSDSSNLVSVIQSGIKALTVATVENAIGSNFADTLTGDANPNKLDGRDDNDKLDGGNGNDTLLGGNGNDTLFGSAGNDVLEGGNGVDLLNGGDGDDRWIFRPGDSGVGAGNRDIVSGFNVPSKAEVIDLSGLGTPLSFIGTAAFSAPGQVRTLADPTNFATIVQINLDNDYTQSEMELEVGLVGATTLTASDFVLG